MGIRRALAGAAVVAVAAVMGPIIGAGVAYAGTPHLAANSPAAGTSTPNPASGNSDTAWALTFSPDQTCPKDSSSEGGNWSSFITPATTDVSQLPFTAGVPSGSGFTNNLFSSTGDQVANGVVSSAPNRLISGLPTFNFSGGGSFGPGSIAPGAYKIGIACFDTTDTNPRFPLKFYSKTVTLTVDTATGGSAQLHYALGASATAPTLNSATPGNGTCAAAFTPAADDPADTSFTVTAHPTSGPDVTQSGAASPITVSGLTNNTAYSVTVTASNGVGGASPASNAISCTPGVSSRNNVQNLTAVPPAPGATSVTLNWNPPAANVDSSTPVSYTVSWTGPTTTGSPASVPFGTNTYTAGPGLATGNYTFTVTAIYSNSPTQGTPVQSVQVSITPSTVLKQQIDVTRPVGALVLTQVCGSNGAVAGDAASPGFPNGTTAVAANHNSTVGSPAAVQPGDTPYLGGWDVTQGGGLGGQDSVNRPGYPYPTDANGNANNIANYPTWCGVHLANAQFVTHGPGSGQYFSTTGVMDQITVVDTTNTDQGWTVTGSASEFTAAGGDHFSSRQLGWTPQISDKTGPFEDGQGHTYTPNPVAGSPVAPGFLTPAATDGLAQAKTMASAAAGSGLGITILDGRLKLLIPVTADSGLYQSTLTISAA